MKVFNITDVSTPALRNQHLENQAIKIVETVVKPGQSADLRGTEREKSEARVYLKLRAIAIDELPPDYAAKKKLDVRGRPLPEPKPEPEPEAKPVTEE